MKINSKSKIIPAIFILSLFGCGNSKHIDDNTMKQTNSTSNSVIWVNSYLGNCSATTESGYFLLTQEGNEKPAAEWDCLYTTIEGFTFEPGYICQLNVETVMLEGKPSLKLIEVISKERDQDYFRIYDIWAATHIDEAVLDVSATRPMMEINLTTMKVMGKGMCNQYFGKISNFNTELIQFGPIAGTKMMCPGMDTETAFLNGLAQTRFYKISKLTLIFYDENKSETLRFQKID